MKKQKIITVVLTTTSVIMVGVYFLLGFLSTYFKGQQSSIQNCQPSQPAQYFKYLRIIQWLNIIFAVNCCLWQLAILIFQTLYQHQQQDRQYKKLTSNRVTICLLGVVFVSYGVLVGHSVKVEVYAGRLLGCTGDPAAMKILSENNIIHIVIAAYGFCTATIRLLYLIVLHQTAPEPHKQNPDQIQKQYSDNIISQNEKQSQNQLINNTPGQITLLPNSQKMNQQSLSSMIVHNQTPINNKQQQQQRIQQHSHYSQQTSSSKKKPKIFGRVLNIPPKPVSPSNKYEVEYLQVPSSKNSVQSSSLNQMHNTMSKSWEPKNPNSKIFDTINSKDDSSRFQGSSKIFK